jgi:hypothetical protein
MIGNGQTAVIGSERAIDRNGVVMTVSDFQKVKITTGIILSKLVAAASSEQVADFNRNCQSF